MKQFLGKDIPKQQKPSPPRKVKPSWFGLLVLPVLLAGGLLSLQSSVLTSETGTRTTGGALGRSLEALEEDRKLAAGPTPDLGSIGALGGGMAGAAAGAAQSALNGAQVKNPCTPEVVSKAFKQTRNANHSVKENTGDVVLFPLIPDGINGYKDDGTRVTDPKLNLSQAEKDAVCSQPFWGREVAYWFLYKVLAILNWMAMAVAILLTLYAATMYIAGFANENNVKKAKSILIGAYAGLAIVFLAKILVYGAVNVISGEDPKNVDIPVNLNTTP